MILRDTQPTKTRERKHLHFHPIFFLGGEPLRRSKRSSCKAQSLEGSQHRNCPLIWQVESMGECWMYFVEGGGQVDKWFDRFWHIFLFWSKSSFGSNGIREGFRLTGFSTNALDLLSTSGVLFWWPPGSGNWPNMQGKECDSRSHCDLNVICCTDVCTL